MNIYSQTLALVDGEILARMVYPNVKNNLMRYIDFSLEDTSDIRRLKLLLATWDTDQVKHFFPEAYNQFNEKQIKKIETTTDTPKVNIFSLFNGELYCDFMGYKLNLENDECLELVKHQLYELRVNQTLNSFSYPIEIPTLNYFTEIVGGTLFNLN